MAKLDENQLNHLAIALDAAALIVRECRVNYDAPLLKEALGEVFVLVSKALEQTTQFSLVDGDPMETIPISSNRHSSE
jgi:hypothetical protein